jgi:hypothetical protein
MVSYCAQIYHLNAASLSEQALLKKTYSAEKKDRRTPDKQAIFDVGYIRDRVRQMTQSPRVLLFFISTTRQKNTWRGIADDFALPVTLASMAEHVSLQR